MSPNKCIQQARNILDQLKNTKWHPMNALPPEDGLLLMRHRKRINEIAHKSGEEIMVNPSLTKENKLTDGFQIFTSMERILTRVNRTNSFNIANESISVWTDGSCPNNGDQEALTGAGIYYGPNDTQNKSIRMPKEYNTNNTGELGAVLVALQDNLPYIILANIHNQEL
jgi:ribonuclease HI